MVTLVGTQTEFIKALKELLELEYEASEIYEAVINRIESAHYKTVLEGFKKDHVEHIKEIASLIKTLKHEPPVGPGGKQWLEIGAIAISKLFGDKAILTVLYQAEKDTVTAYTRMSQHEGLLVEATSLIEANLNDEKKHKSWIESIINE